MSTKPRTRLSAEARRLQLLDTAKKMISADGLQNFTMEALGRNAGVTSPQVYNYFSSRQLLLAALLEHEYSNYVTQMTSDLDDASEFEDVVRIFIRSNFDHYATGNIIPVLSSQPEIAAAIAPKQQEIGQQIAVYLVENTAESYQLTKALAYQAVSMSSGASIAAAEYFSKFPADRDQAIENTLAYILAGLERIASQ